MKSRNLGSSVTFLKSNKRKHGRLIRALKRRDYQNDLPERQSRQMAISEHKEYVCTWERERKSPREKEKGRMRERERDDHNEKHREWSLMQSCVWALSLPPSPSPTLTLRCRYHRRTNIFLYASRSTTNCRLSTLCTVYTLYKNIQVHAAVRARRVSENEIAYFCELL